MPPSIDAQAPDGMVSPGMWMGGMLRLSTENDGARGAQLMVVGAARPKYTCCYRSQSTVDKTSIDVAGMTNGGGAGHRGLWRTTDDRGGMFIGKMTWGPGCLWYDRRNGIGSTVNGLGRCRSMSSSVGDVNESDRCMFCVHGLHARGGLCGISGPTGKLEARAGLW